MFIIIRIIDHGLWIMITMKQQSKRAMNSCYQLYTISGRQPVFFFSHEDWQQLYALMTIILSDEEFAHSS